MTCRRMTCRPMTPGEIERADAAYRQWWLWFLTLGLYPKPGPEAGLTPDLDAWIRPDGTRVHLGHRCAERRAELEA